MIYPRLFAFIALITGSACVSQTDQRNTLNENSPVAISASNIDLVRPLEISNKPEDAALAERLDEIVSGSKFPDARWGIIVVSLRDGRVLAAKDAQKLFTPASIQKILTSVTALERLGPEYRWQTTVFGSAKINAGTLEGNLVLYGQGAPDFDTAGLENLAIQLKEKGLTRITGDVIGDESFFTGDDLGDGWAWNAAQWYYGAASSALSINQNQATITLQDGKPRSDDKFVELSGEVKPVEDIEAIGVKRELGTNKVYVWGNGRDLNVRIAVSDPARFSAKIFKEVLEKNGIRIDGTDAAADWKSQNKLNVANSVELASVESATLAEIVRQMNKDSVNLYAELILRTLGKRFGAEAPDDDPKMQKLRGDDLAGASVVRKWLSDRNAASGEIRIHDGSGLSRLDLVTPETVARALIAASQSAFAKDFQNSLPVAGQSGTLRGRLGNVEGRILAKTGSITYVGSLAGYANTKSGETLAFVIICNNATRAADPAGVIDQLVTAIAGR